MNKFGVLLAIGLLINGCLGSAVRPNPVRGDDDGWTRIAHRFNGHVNFYRNWNDFKDGFGDVDGEFFIGLQELHEITSSGRHELHVYLEDFEGESRYEIYDNFLVGSEDEKFVLKSIGGHTGDAKDSLFFNVGSKFSTYDSDNDSSRGNCAQLQMGSWWYYDCSYANPFGLYLGGAYGKEYNTMGMFWWTWRGPTYSYKVMTMKIRPVHN